MSYSGAEDSPYRQLDGSSKAAFYLLEPVSSKERLQPVRYCNSLNQPEKVTLPMKTSSGSYTFITTPGNVELSASKGSQSMQAVFCMGLQKSHCKCSQELSARQSSP